MIVTNFVILHGVILLSFVASKLQAVHADHIPEWTSELNANTSGRLQLNVMDAINTSCVSVFTNVSNTALWTFDVRPGKMFRVTGDFDNFVCREPNAVLYTNIKCGLSYDGCHMTRQCRLQEIRDQADLRVSCTWLCNCENSDCDKIYMLATDIPWLQNDNMTKGKLCDVYII